ncbi:MAG: rhomboid family intramembrane serine protease [Candidatus Metalachnospira sp.]|nr:rhomboid family intramembrane serine protease [Candidatus Metalachnospira sp.]
MFGELIKKVAIELSAKQFELLSVIRDKRGNEVAAIYFKAESPVIYFVSVVDFDFILSSEYKNSITETMRKTLDDSREIFNDAVCVHLLVGMDFASLKEFADKQNSVYDGSIHNIWWYTDGENTKIYSGKGQPDKIHGIERILNSALMNDNSDIGVSIEKISEDGVKKSQLKQVAKFPLLVVFLIIINLVIFVFEIYGGNKNFYIYKFGIDNSLIFSDRQFYRLLTYMFIHGSIEHVLMNCLALYIYGSKVEKYCGRLKACAIYFVSGAAGGLLSACFNKGFAVGASGAVFGMMGALLAICKKTGKQIDGLSYITMAVLAVVSIGMGFLEPQIDNLGHIGGLIGGFVIGIFLYKDKKE